jgi:GPH family glycoside/pentoside/hexuronide:cation symporter
MALSIGQKAGWGLADMGVNVFVVAKQLLVLAFLTQYLGVPIALAGIMTTGVLLFDIFTDPMIGYLSDKTNTRWGRRAPWMMAGAVVLALALVALFSVPQRLETSGNLAWVCGFFVVATIGFTMIAIPYGAQAGEMTQDPRERSAMTGWRMGFASVGILVGGALIPAFAAAMGHASAMVIFAPVIVIAVWLSVFLTRKAPRILTPSTENFMGMVRLVLSNRPFVILVALYGFMTLGIAILTASVPFAALYLINDPGNSPLSQSATGLPMESLMFAAFVVGSILSQAIWVFLSGRLGKVAALCLGLMLYVLVLIGVFLALPSGNLGLVFLVFLCVGLANGAYQQIPWAIYPDLMDVTRRQSGEAIEGAFSAIWLFGQKVANAFGPLVLSLILGFAGWHEARGEKVVQSADALATLQAAATLAPAVILAVSVLFILKIYKPAVHHAATQ